MGALWVTRSSRYKSLRDHIGGQIQKLKSDRHVLKRTAGLSSVFSEAYKAYEGP